MDKEFYIDFDGVIVDTQKKIDEYFKLFDNTITPEWDLYLENINWAKRVLSEAKEINNSFTILKELYKLKRNFYILSRVFSPNEFRDKQNFLRENGIYMPIIPVMKRLPKSLIIPPRKNRILIDDSASNLKDWIDNNGTGIYFTENLNDTKINNDIFINSNADYWKDENNQYYFRDNVDNLSFLLQKK